MGKVKRKSLTIYHSRRKMFTGIIEKVVPVQEVKRDKEKSVLKIKLDYENLKIGESISVNGVCLTLIDCRHSVCSFDFMPETAKKSNIGDLTPGDYVNVERSLKFDGRISGHFVQGHVDTQAKYRKFYEEKNSKIMIFELAAESIKLLVNKASISINGISLTIIHVDKLNNQFSVGIIPHTLQNTNLQYLKFGDKVNIEIDLFAKYVKNFMNHIKN